MSETAICNQALSWLGAGRILSLDDGTELSDLCKDNYEPLRDAVLEEARWTFATKRYEFLPMAEEPAYGYSTQFLIPTEVLNVIEVREDQEFRPNGISNLDWRKEGDRILTNVDVIYAKCVVRVIDTTKFSRLFTQALAARIALELAPTITESNTKTQIMQAKYDDSIKLAIAMDGAQGRSDIIRNRQLTSFVR